MESFRHNLNPLEVKRFLKLLSTQAEHLFIRFCFKTSVPCPRCGAGSLCRAGALSFYASNPDKLTHEITACLECGQITITMLRTLESL